MGWRGFILAAAVGTVALAPAAWSRGPRHPERLARPGMGPKTPPTKTPIDEFERMPQQQQQRALNRLPARQRQQLEERLDRFNRLPPEQQQTLRNLYNRLHQLPPNRQNAVRDAINRFSEQKPGRQQAMRDELRGMAALPQQERDSGVASREFRSRFSGKEQGIVRDMLPLLPPAN